MSPAHTRQLTSVIMYLLETGRIKLHGVSAELLASEAIRKAYLGL